MLIAELVCSSQTASANINLIDFSLVPYPKEQQSKIDFLKQNVSLYNHWSPQWQAGIAKSEVVDNLKSLYVVIDQIPNKNAETYLLLGDIAHYLYNLDAQDFYDKAVYNYTKAKDLSPDDYRVYWFLGNHHALAAEPTLAIQTYQLAQKHLPAKAPFIYWADYSGACANAGMLSTAYYAAHQASVAQGTTSEVEQQVARMVKKTYIPPRIDTTIQDREVWGLAGRNKGNIVINNAVIGLQFQTDSLWHLQLGGYDKHICYAVISPQEATGKDRKKTGYTFLILAKVPDKSETLQQFLDKFTKSNKKKIITTAFNNTYGGLAYEMRDADIYPDCGGSHGYAIAIERDMPEYPGQKIEMPMQMPKGSDGKPSYFVMNPRFSRLTTKLYYLIMLDSCEHIHDESLSVFNIFLNNLIVE